MPKWKFWTDKIEKKDQPINSKRLTFSILILNFEKKMIHEEEGGCLIRQLCMRALIA